MITTLTKVKDMVLFELENRPETRSSDRLLIYYVYRDYYGIGNFHSFKDVMERQDLPSFETIRRCRAKAQEIRPDLKANDDVIAFREDNEQAYFTFFGEV